MINAVVVESGRAYRDCLPDVSSRHERIAPGKATSSKNLFVLLSDCEPCRICAGSSAMHRMHPRSTLDAFQPLYDTSFSVRFLKPLVSISSMPGHPFDMTYRDDSAVKRTPLSKDAR